MSALKGSDGCFRSDSGGMLQVDRAENEKCHVGLKVGACLGGRKRGCGVGDVQVEVVG